nr:hypothetical protein [Mycobacterium sp. E3298]
MSDRNKLVQMGIDLYKGSVGNFSADEVEHNFRKALNQLTGGEKFDAKAFRRNKIAIFEVMEEVLDVAILEGIENQFAEFVEYRNVSHGDKPIFMVEDYKLFPVATIASGTNNIRRQRLDRTGLSVTTGYKGVKIYEELERFLAGKVDWAKLVAKVQKSFNAQIAADIYAALQAGYGSLSAPYKYSGSWDLTQFNTLISHIEAATGLSSMVFGTKLALQNVAPAYVAYNGQLIADRNNDGYFKVVDGTVLTEIKQSHVPGGDTFAISNKDMIIVPNGQEKIIKLVVEGDSEITESVDGQNADESKEFLFKKKYGVGVVAATRYGAYLLP